MPKKRNKSDRKSIDLEVHRLHLRYDILGRIVEVISKYGTIAFCFYVGADTLKAFAGKETVADLAFSFFLNEKLAWVLAVIFGSGGVIYGRNQRRLRKDVIEKMSHYQRQYEEWRDRGRTSSELTRRGDTPEEGP